MSAHAFSSWGAGKLPTPVVADARKGPNSDVRRNSPSLRMAVPALPTLTTKSSHRQQDATGERVSLQQRVHLLPTPTANSYGTNRGGGAGRVGKVRPSLRGLVPTLTVKGNYNRAGSSARAGDGLATRIGAGPLNPQWLEWLMGFPDGWTENAHSGTQSSRSARSVSGT